MTCDQEITTLQRPNLSREIRDRLTAPARSQAKQSRILQEATHNPSIREGQYSSSPWAANGNGNVVDLEPDQAEA